MNRQTRDAACWKSHIWLRDTACIPHIGWISVHNDSTFTVAFESKYTDATLARIQQAGGVIVRTVRSSASHRIRFRLPETVDT